MGKEVLANPIAMITGYFADFTLAVLLGVMLVYVMRIMGKDYAIIKGIMFGAASYVLIYGIAMTLNFTRVSLLTPLPNFVLLFPHVIFGGIAGWVIKRYGNLEEQV